MIGGLTKGDKTAEAGKTSDQSENYDVESVIRAASCTWYAIHRLLVLYGEEKEKLCYSSRFTLPFISLKNRINEVEKENPSTKDSATIKFCSSIAENDKLCKELRNLNNLAENFANKEFDSQLEKIITGFKLKDLEDKVGFLVLLKKESDFTAIQKAYRDEWSFYDLINDRDFKQTYIDKAVTESANKSFKEDINKCIKLAEQGKKAASKYFERKDVELQAYYTETDNAHRVLNVNLINYNRSEPTRISDILQQEKDIKELNIYCNKKHEIHAHQKDKKRYYEFKEGAYYEMTSTWPVKDESGNVSICTMIMNVSSDGITEVLKFDGEDFVSLEEILELIKQNDELYIQGLSLHDAVMKSLEKGKAADVISTANNNFQNESIAAYQDKEPEGKLDPKVDGDNSLPSSPSINSNVLIQTEVKLQQIATQTEINSQQITDLQNRFGKEEQKNTKLQTELAQKDEELASALAELQGKAQELKSVYEEKGKLRQELGVANAKKEELKSELKKSQEELYHVQEGKSDLEDKFDHLEHLNKKMDGNQEQLSEQVLDLQKKLSCSEKVTQELINKLKSAEAEKKEVNQKLAEAGQRIETLKKQTSDLQDKLEKKERGFKAERDAMCKELTQLKENLERNEKELKSVYEEKRKLEDKLKGVNTEKKELEDKLKEFEKEIGQAAHIMKEKEQFISNLKRQMLEYKAQLESYEQEIAKLENMHDEFKEYVASILESTDREHEDKIKELEENHDALSDIIADKVLDIEGLKKELQDSKKEIEDLRNQVEMLSAETSADKQKGLNDQFYTLTGDISSEPHNAPLQQRKLLRSSSVPPEEERRLSRSSSFDKGYNSDGENYGNNLPSSIGSDISIEKVAKGGNVGSSPPLC
ncbi:hypothetical protein [Wolbachia endosymbiont (group A) of Colletes cunicularius]|uniref:hypothetical protein n=1 Tax=Wolbachia endosymbiont (group A) of Colletes cunicularius TaxID=3139321 RepID=UPI0035C8E50C